MKFLLFTFLVLLTFQGVLSDCKSKLGRFADTTDKTCKKYSYCFMKNNVLTELFYTCVGTTLFDPKKQLCVTDFKCK